jgi:predicted small lipoprotein YifL
MRTLFSSLLLLALMLGISACGVKGDLTHPRDIEKEKQAR